MHTVKLLINRDQSCPTQSRFNRGFKRYLGLSHPILAQKRIEIIARMEIIPQLITPNGGYVHTAMVVHVPAEPVIGRGSGHSLAFRAVSFDSKAQCVVLAVWRINSDYCSNWALICNTVACSLSLVDGSPPTVALPKRKVIFTV